MKILVSSFSNGKVNIRLLSLEDFKKTYRIMTKFRIELSNSSIENQVKLQRENKDKFIINEIDADAYA